MGVSRVGPFGSVVVIAHVNLAFDGRGRPCHSDQDMLDQDMSEVVFI